MKTHRKPEESQCLATIPITEVELTPRNPNSYSISLSAIPQGHKFSLFNLSNFSQLRKNPNKSHIKKKKRMKKIKGKGKEGMVPQ